MGHKHAVIAQWRGEIPLYAVAVAMLIMSTAILAPKGIYPSDAPIWVSVKIFAASILPFAIISVSRLLVRTKPHSPLAAIKSHYLSAEFGQFALRGLPILIILILLMPFYSLVKGAIHLFQPYSWDATFIAWDETLFAGVQAWEVLQPVLGFPIITATLAVLYHVWMLLLFPGCLYFAFGKVDPLLRRQFVLVYLLSWALIGGLLATWFASVGPCFVGPIMGNPLFDPQMAYLNAANEQIPIVTLEVQNHLLEQYSAETNGLGVGISAMPSMHVAIAFLYWLTMRRHSRKLAMVFGAFFAITWISSVHLAYHYAVDGLLSVVAVAVLWKSSYAVLAAWDRYIEKRGGGSQADETLQPAL